MAVKKLHIGTSGWSYKDWKGLYYPEGLKPAEWLTFYAKQFDITEINTSFYHLPRKQTALNWAAKVPAGFRFCPKISRYLTHMKKLHEPEEPLQRFFEVFEPIKDVLGPVLVQLPPSLKFDYELAENFFKILNKDYKEFEFALEVRHNTWLENDSLDLMAKYNVAFVISQSGVNFPYAEVVTAKNIYIRFHGPGALYASSYSAEMLQDFAGKFKHWIKEGHTIWAFFNNDYFGHAIQNAQRLKDLIKAGT
jgi:uncharacterized protein YecE (DUF72 family)